MESTMDMKKREVSNENKERRSEEEEPPVLVLRLETEFSIT